MAAAVSLFSLNVASVAALFFSPPRDNRNRILAPFRSIATAEKLFFLFLFFFPESDKQQYHSIERKQGATNIIRKPFSPEFLIYWSIGFFAYINLKHCAAYVLLYNVKTKTAYTVYRQI